jgi:hypothetical protein
LAALLPVEKLALDGDFAAWQKYCFKDAVGSNAATIIPAGDSGQTQVQASFS